MWVAENFQLYICGWYYTSVAYHWYKRCEITYQTFQ